MTAHHSHPARFAGGVPSSRPASDHPERAGGCAQSSLLELPGASASGAFVLLSGQRHDVAPSAVRSSGGGRGFRFLQRHIHAERTGAFQFVQEQAGAKLGGGDTAAQTQLNRGAG